MPGKKLLNYCQNQTILGLKFIPGHSPHPYVLCQNQTILGLKSNTETDKENNTKGPKSDYFRIEIHAALMPSANWPGPKSDYFRIEITVTGDDIDFRGYAKIRLF